MALHFPLQIPTSVSVPSGLCFFHPLVSSYELPQSLLIFLALNASFCCPFIVDLISVFSLHSFKSLLQLARPLCVVSVSFRYVTCGLISILTQMFYELREETNDIGLKSCSPDKLCHNEAGVFFINSSQTRRGLRSFLLT